MAKVKAPQRPLPFVADEQFQRLGADVHHRTVELLKQMLIDAILGDPHTSENHHERKDSADAS